MSKILLATAILGLGIAGALFAVQNTDLSASRDSIIDIGNNNLITGGPFVEKISDKSNQLANDGTSITDEFAKKLAEKISEANPSGPQLNGDKKDIAVPNPDEIALELIADSASKFDLKKFFTEIKDSDLKIIKDSRRDTVLDYGKKFDRIIFESRKKNIENSGETFTEENLADMIATFQKAVKDLYSLPVPELMLGIHKTQLKYLSAETKLLEKIKDAQNDPMSAILSSQAMPDMEKEFNAQMKIEVEKFLTKIYVP